MAVNCQHQFICHLEPLVFSQTAETITMECGTGKTSSPRREIKKQNKKNTLLLSVFSYQNAHRINRGFDIVTRGKKKSVGFDANAFPRMRYLSMRNHVLQI